MNVWRRLTATTKRAHPVVSRVKLRKFHFIATVGANLKFEHNLLK